MTIFKGTKYITDPDSIPVTATGGTVARSLGSWTNDFSATFDALRPHPVNGRDPSLSYLIDADWLYVGQRVKTLGYYTPGDGGDGDYKVVASGTGSNYGFIYEQLSASGLEAKMISGGIMEDKTAYIPTDYATLQEAIDDLSTLVTSQGSVINLLIETGHQPASGVLVENGDYGHFQISSVDAEVTLDASFPAVDVIKGVNAGMPTLNCLINANALGRHGYFADQNSSGYVTPGSGVRRCNRQACYANSGSNITADESVFTEASQESPAYSGILAWASTISAFGADASGSLYYGAQAAASGTLNFRNGIADGAARHGVRATNGALVNARSASSQNCGVTGFRSFDSGIIHATGSNASGSLGNAYLAKNNSKITADNVIADAVTSVFVALDSSQILSRSPTTTAGSVRTENGSKIHLINPDITSSGTRVLTAAFGSEIITNGGSVTGGNGDRVINIVDGSRVVCTGTSLSADSTETYLATVDNGSELTILDGTHSYPNDAVNLIGGSLLRLNGSGIPASDVPGMLNGSLTARGIMWGASS